MSHVVLCVHAVVCGLKSVHRALHGLQRSTCQTSGLTHYGGHVLCVVHVRAIDGLVNKRLYTVYVRLVFSLLLILHASGARGRTLSHSYKQLMLNCLPGIGV